MSTGRCPTGGWLIIGLGVETVGIDAGAAHGFDPPFPPAMFCATTPHHDDPWAGTSALLDVDAVPA